ncbi:DUF4290 domain-containing protein [Portibacter marinus]|uniref:DUF4290 domain-containing protein n=1 Tax=Portibacter marinus TaxID=2898660 RepID=UPI001F1835BB|nr:DUF4290 domain-containing protein [Portibacter marinus]
MEYNTEKDPLVISEYGRNVQNLINYAKTVEDKEQRQKYAERIVALMYQMNPDNKNINNYRAKLWSHLLRIADYDIEVDAPEDSILAKEDVVKPETLSYPRTVRRYRHYGSNVMALIEKAIAMEEGPKKDAFAETIARYMKLAYRTWNREHYVSDEIIIEDLEKISKGKLKLADNYNLNIGKDDRDTNTNSSGSRRGSSNRKNYRKNSNKRYSNNRNKRR